MGRGRFVLAAATASCLLAACGNGGGDTGPSLTPGDATSVAGAPTSSLNAHSTSADLATTTVAPVTTAAPTTAAPATPAPTAAPPPQSVAPPPPSSDPAARTHCLAPPDPPADASALQATFADVDADGRVDVLWLYDYPDGTHLQVRTGRGATDNLLLPYGTGAVAVGAGQVDLAIGTADPGTAQEIFAVTSGGDGRRLVGVYSFAINTGCLNPFTFDQGNPFVYLISRQGTLSGLRCVNDGVNGHIEGLTASPAAGDSFTTSRLVFGRIGRRLVPVSYETGSLAPPVDPAAIAAGSDVTGCSLSRSAF
jgi:hypothetical protein